jgi:hypothetical protein
MSLKSCSNYLLLSTMLTLLKVLTLSGLPEEVSLKFRQDYTMFDMGRLQI